MIVLSQALEPLRAESDDDPTAMTWHAREAGWTVHRLPRELTREGLDEAFAAIPVQPQPTPTLVIGLIMDEALYRRVDALARERRMHLVNDPEQHLATFVFDRFYERLADLTPKSIVRPLAHGVDGTLRDALAALRPPWFIKGALQSLKHRGWQACVAHTPDALRQAIAAVHAEPFYARGHVVVRELVALEKVDVPAMHMPMGREFRVFLHAGEVLGHGFYWRYFDAFALLDEAEERAVLDLAREAARRVGSPLVSVDIGQLEDGRWIVIEVGDPQFSGPTYIPLAAFWSRLSARL